MLSVWIRNHITDRSLASLREQISQLIPDQASVVEVGCANGRLLFDNAGRIRQGFGVDLNGRMIAFAEKKSHDNNCQNIAFRAADALAIVNQLPFPPSVTICSLCLHEMPEKTAIKVIQQYSEASDEIIIADLFEPEDIFGKTFLHFDEWIAGHYGQFKSYLQNGGMPGLLEKSGVQISKELDGQISGIKIWVSRKSPRGL